MSDFDMDILKQFGGKINDTLEIVHDKRMNVFYNQTHISDIFFIYLQSVLGVFLDSYQLHISSFSCLKAYFLLLSALIYSVTFSL